MKPYIRPEKRQLFFLVDSLSSCVSNESNLRGLVGYGIVGSLGSYSSSDFTRQPKSYREIQTIYEALEKIRSQCIDLMDSPEGVDPVLLNLKKEVHPTLLAYLAGDIKQKPESHLLEALLPSMSQKNMEGVLSAFGDSVIGCSKERGPLLFPRNRTFTEDYKLLVSCLRR